MSRQTAGDRGRKRCTGGTRSCASGRNPGGTRSCASASVRGGDESVCGHAVARERDPPGVGSGRRVPEIGGGRCGAGRRSGARANLRRRPLPREVLRREVVDLRCRDVSEARRGSRGGRRSLVRAAVQVPRDVLPRRVRPAFQGALEGQLLVAHALHAHGHGVHPTRAGRQPPSLLLRGAPQRVPFFLRGAAAEGLFREASGMVLPRERQARAEAALSRQRRDERIRPSISSRCRRTTGTATASARRARR